MQMWLMRFILFLRFHPVNYLTGVSYMKCVTIIWRNLITWHDTNLWISRRWRINSLLFLFSVPAPFSAISFNATDFWKVSFINILQLLSTYDVFWLDTSWSYACARTNAQMTATGCASVRQSVGKPKKCTVNC